MSQYLEQKKIAVTLRRWLLGYTINSKLDMEDLTGIARVRFLEYLTAQFTEGMSWFNYGKVWNLDHIVPISLLDQFSQDERKLCWHYLNTRPVTLKANRHKSASLLESVAELDRRLKILPGNQTLLALKAKCQSELDKQGEGINLGFLTNFVK